MKTLFRIIGICTFAVLGLVGCDGDDCPTCPTCPKEDTSRYPGYAYVTTTSLPVAVYIIDIEADSVVDSLVDEQLFPFGALQVDVSTDGKYLIALNYGIGLTLYELPSFQVMSQRVINGYAYLVSWKNQLLQQGTEGFTLYQLPSLEPILTRNPDITSGMIWLDEETNSFMTSAFPDSLVTIDLDSLSVKQSWRIADPQGFGYTIRKFCWSKELGMVYLIVDGTAFIVYDLNTSQVVSKTRIRDSFGDLRVNPSEKEVYVTDPMRDPTDREYPGNVYVFDAQTGALLDLISLYGIWPDFPYAGMAAYEIEITPDGKDLILGFGRPRFAPGNVARVKIKERKVEKLYFKDFDHFPSDIVIGPKPQ